LDQQDGNVRRFTLFPFYFQQRAADSSLNYTAVFPLYGRLKNRLFRDEIRFVLFPLYGQSRKRDVGDGQLPLSVLSPPPRRRSARLAILASGRIRTQRRHLANQQRDEVETVGGHSKFSLLWPIFFNQTLAGNRESRSASGIAPRL